ncbi:MATE family efflux transporter [Candidatus Sororendozoicomonas aggregata]|uniref:MATE family efflux transporter n=1 Tax=Candidatus Sororendozoicomonas aggregata TaxID=3073239 RepID=UPI002ED5C3D6
MNVTVPRNKNALSEHSISKIFWRYTLPAVASMLVNGLYSTIDGIFIGQVVGASGLAAINLAWPLFGLIVGVGMMAGMGAATLFSIARGEQAHQKAQQFLESAILLIVIASVALAPTLYFTSGSLLSIMGAKGELLTLADDYLKIISAGAFFAIGAAALPLIVRNNERPQLATAIIITGAVFNIIFDYLFIVIFRWSISGAAIATLLGEAITVIWSLGYLFSAQSGLKLSFRHLTRSAGHFNNILATGLPSFGIFIYFSFVTAFHNRLFLAYGSSLTLAAFTIVGYIQAVYYMAAEGVANGIQPIVSYNKGARNNKNIRDVIKLSVGTVLTTGIAATLFIFIWPQEVAAIFNHNNTALINKTAMGLKLHLFSMYLDGFIVVVAAYFQALARHKIATWITMGNMLIQIPLLLTLPEWLGVTGVWISLPVSNIFLAVIVARLLWTDLKLRPVNNSSSPFA